MADNKNEIVKTGRRKCSIAVAKVVSGNKETDKIYYHHTGFPGGLKSASVKEVREKDATKLIEKAVKGMLQHNTLGAEQFNKLKVYCGPEHPHAAQKPVVLEKEAK